VNSNKVSDETIYPEVTSSPDVPKLEESILAIWESNGTFQASVEGKKNNLKDEKDLGEYVFYDGPPFANGLPHYGHLVTGFVKDTVPRYQTMKGKKVARRFGWDTHGLPAEMVAEKETGVSGRNAVIEYGIDKFNAACRESVMQYADDWRFYVNRMARWVDFDNDYKTLDVNYMESVIWAFSELYKKGLIYEGLRVLPYSWAAETVLSNHETKLDDSYRERDDPALTVAFTVNQLSEKAGVALADVLSGKSLNILAWTTTPWTLPANEAVCLNPEVDYSLIETHDSYSILATDLSEEAMARYGIDDYKIAGQVKGRVFENLKLNHPFYAKQVPVILGDHVTTESGTGAVHTAPAHGPDDYTVGKLYDLPLENPVKANGCFSDDVEFFAGQSVFKANDNILAVLRDKGVLLAHTTIRHSYPHCWRHKSPMIFLATPQWFISMDKNNLRLAIVDQISTVSWVPDWGKARISNMVENRPDWCISRQRAWGTPMPLFVHSTTRELHPNTLELIEQVAGMIEKSGIDAWFELDAIELLGDDAKFYDKITDTMDVWLDSGVSHYAVLKQNKELSFPADIYFEGSDQHRGWFNSSLTTAVAMYGKAPYKTVLTHGFTVDAEGKKLSKSKGNYVALDKLINQHGADILRLWVASTDYRHEVCISDEIIKRNADAYRRIRNTARFLLANLCDFDPARDCLAGSGLLELDKWAIQRTKQLQDDIISAYENFQFHVIYQKIHNFCAVDMGSFYLDLIKDRQYTCAKDSKARRSCQTAMYHIVQAFTLWLAPILSFTAEEIWQAIPESANKNSIFIEQWYSNWPVIEAIDMDNWEQLHLIRDEVNKSLEEKRQQGIIGSALAAEVTLYADAKVLPKLTRLGEELRFLLITSGAFIYPIDKAPASLTVNEYGLAIDVAASAHEKCARCWHRRPDVGANQEHSELCLRCVGNISGQNEQRRFI